MAADVEMSPVVKLPGEPITATAGPTVKETGKGERGGTGKRWREGRNEAQGHSPKSPTQCNPLASRRQAKWRHMQKRAALLGVDHSWAQGEEAVGSVHRVNRQMHHCRGAEGHPCSRVDRQRTAQQARS
eukprot:EG_transcript_6980